MSFPLVDRCHMQPLLLQEFPCIRVMVTIQNSLLVLLAK